MSIAIRKPRPSINTYKAKPVATTSKASALLALNNLDFPQEPEEIQEVAEEPVIAEQQSDDLNNLISAIGRKI